MNKSESATSARRQFLVGALLAFAGGFSSARPIGRNTDSHPSLPELVSNDPGTQIWLGERYLEMRPEERSAQRLCHELFGTDVDTCSSRIGSGELLRRIRHRRAADFREGQLVVIGGWLLARTEARVFALAAVSTEG